MTLQYRTIEEGRLRFEGPDAAPFLHALVTNDVEGLAPGRGCYAAWLTPQGRMITDLLLLRDETGVWAEVPVGMAPALQARFDQLIFSEDVRVTDVTADTIAALVAGADAAAGIAAATGADVTAIEALPVFGHLTAGGFRVVRTDQTALPTFQVWSPKMWAEKVSGAFSEAGSAEKAPETFFEALRIEAGRPKFGVDMTTDTIPLEAGLLERAISQTKGCYVGQEVVVRILHRGGGKVIKHLVTLTFDEAVSAVPAAGTVLAHDGKDVGAVTSAARSLTTGRIIALGYVHRDAATAGQVLQSPAGTVTITGFAG